MSTERFILQINLFVQPIPGIKDEAPEICRVTGCNSVMGSSLQNPESGCFNPRVVCVGQTAFQVNRKMVQKVKVPMDHYYAGDTNGKPQVLLPNCTQCTIM